MLKKFNKSYKKSGIFLGGQKQKLKSGKSFYKVSEKHHFFSQSQEKKCELESGNPDIIAEIWLHKSP